MFTKNHYLMYYFPAVVRFHQPFASPFSVQVVHGHAYPTATYLYQRIRRIARRIGDRLQDELRPRLRENPAT